MGGGGRIAQALSDSWRDVIQKRPLAEMGHGAFGPPPPPGTCSQRPRTLFTEPPACGQRSVLCSMSWETLARQTADSVQVPNVAWLL